MKYWVSRSALLGTAIWVTAATFSLDAAAEKIEHVLTKSNLRTATRSATTINDVAGHEIGFEMVLANVKSSSPKLELKEGWIYNNFDYVEGNGRHYGKFIVVHKDGSQAYGEYEGTTKTVSNADGSWVATWEGKHRFTGGSGKLKNLKGGGTYDGRETSTGEFREELKETLEF
jgi:hypothetical protein